uniref:DNA cross-link repair 1A n=1 Tax=Callithrix jacchus TaxID=9483 RepID=A0A5F4WI40_CALJA|nr:DNA cross-link repair 1A protein isoform X2 [Callithrix jacchus]
MLEDISEEDIWEYKSKRKPKRVDPNNCSKNILKSVKKGTDGKYQSKRNRKRKRATEAKEKVKDHEISLEEADCQTSAASSQNSSSGDGIQQSQDKETTPGKLCRTQKSKHVSPKIRPVYDGYCPNCQMPFSSLIGQTPRWHVFECLDSPPGFETECPDGLLCTSTIPFHYKRYTHFLLAQSRASEHPFSSPSPAPGDSFSETKSGILCSFEERWSLNRNQTDNSVSNDPLLMTQYLRKSPSPTEANKKISTNIQTSQQALQFTEVVENKLVGVALPLADEELSSPNNSEHINLPLPENDFSDCGISYSPLQSDEDPHDINEKLDDSQQELFFTESSKDGSLEEDDSCTLLIKQRSPLLKDQDESCPKVNSFLTQDKHDEELYRFSSLNDLFQPISQNNESTLPHEAAYRGGDFVLFPPALAGKLAASVHQATKVKPREPEFHSSQSNNQKQVIEESAVYNQVSLSLVRSLTSKPFESQVEGYLSSQPTQSKNRKLSSESLNVENNANSACFCRKKLDGIPVGKATILNTENFSSTPAATSLKILPSGPKCNARHPSTKVMKQTDIGVYFGLPPKRKEGKLPEESALKGINLNPVPSPNKKRSWQCKRKAEKSLSDLEFDAKNVNESQLSVELSSERSQRQKKRLKKSNSPQEGAHQKRADHLTNAESETVNLSKVKVFTKSAHGGLQRRDKKIPESSNVGELRKKSCPFYKKIPGTGFTVDAFQYGVVEGCTAYFLTHFHSDHYAGLSKHFTFPVYCSEITGNLLKNKLHVQEQYIHPLPLDTECIVNGVKVVLLDANQYCSPEYTFPSQQEVIQFAINTAFEAVTLNPRALVVCGTYSIGKEKVFLAIADVLGSKVGMSQEKYKTLQCLNIPDINSLITTDMCSSLVHLLPMMQINFKGLQSHLKKYGGKYDQILAFRPTGWTHSNKFTRIADVIPQTKGNISIYGIPYSEHSSFLEMKRFVQWLKPQKIIPTVNVGTWKSRSTMEKHFREWKLEAGY